MGCLNGSIRLPKRNHLSIQPHTRSMRLLFKIEVFGWNLIMTHMHVYLPWEEHTRDTTQMETLSHYCLLHGHVHLCVAATLTWLEDNHQKCAPSHYKLSCLGKLYVTCLWVVSLECASAHHSLHHHQSVPISQEAQAYNVTKTSLAETSICFVLIHCGFVQLRLCLLAWLLSCAHARKG